jgi:hypothetical protein
MICTSAQSAKLNKQQPECFNPDSRSKDADFRHIPRTAAEKSLTSGFKALLTASQNTSTSALVVCPR